MPVKVYTDLGMMAGPPELTTEVARFLARANCLAEIENYTYELHGSPPHESIAAQTAALAPTTRRRTLDGQTQRLLRVAWQTELTVRLTSVFEEPALQRVTTHTLPVNAYYALFNAHRALSRARGSPVDSHRGVQDGFAKHGAAKVPMPWSATLAGDPEDIDSCALSPEFMDCLSVDPLRRSYEPAAYVLAALRMTRRWKYEQTRLAWLYAKENRKADGQVRKRLPAGESTRIAKQMRPTSLLDFFYELRRQTHYETTDEYGTEVTDDDVERFHRGVDRLLDHGMLIIETQLARAVGVSELRSHAATWERSTRRIGSWASESLHRRLAAVGQALPQRGSRISPRVD